jgi:hypothetical protein
MGHVEVAVGACVTGSRGWGKTSAAGSSSKGELLRRSFGNGPRFAVFPEFESPAEGYPFVSIPSRFTTRSVDTKPYHPVKIG